MRVSNGGPGVTGRQGRTSPCEQGTQGRQKAGPLVNIIGLAFYKDHYDLEDPVHFFVSLFIHLLKC